METALQCGMLAAMECWIFRSGLMIIHVLAEIYFELKKGFAVCLFNVHHCWTEINVES